MKLNSSVRIQPRGRLVTASLVLGLLAAVQSASAAVQYWDPGATFGTGSGGNGTWATANTNWTDGSTNTTDAVLTTTNIADFSGTAGTVTLTSSVTTAGLQFDTSNYTIGDGSTSGQISIGAQTNNTSGIVVSSGVTSITLNVGSIKLGAASGVNILLTSTDNVDFKNTAVYLSGSRTTVLTNSSSSGTTTFTNFAVSDKAASGSPTAPNTTISIAQGNLSIHNLAGGINGTTFNAWAGTNNISTTITGSSTGTVTIDGNNSLYNNNTSTGTVTLNFNMAGGTLALGNDNALGARNTGGSLTSTVTVLQMSAGTLRADGGARTIANTINWTGNTTIGGSNDLTLSGTGTLTSGKTLTVANTGITTLAGANTLTGGTIAVNSGAKLLINGTSTGGTYSLASGATFGGTGTVDLSAANGSVTLGNGSFLQASSADSLVFNLGSGVLNVSGALANASSSMLFTLGVPGTTVVSATSANIGSGLLEFADFNFTAGTGFDAGTYTLFQLTSLTGSFGPNLTGTVGGLDATISQSGNDIILTTVSAVPEPSTFAALAGVGVLGAALLRRRRRN